MSFVAENLARILDEIHSCQGSGDHVKLLAVSKRKPVEMMLEAYQAGQRHFGENKVQEARNKKPELTEDINLHLIGPLQSNKAKYCPSLFTHLHTLHRADIAELLNQKYQAADKQLRVFIQINLSDEESKSGLREEKEIFQLAEQVCTLSHLKLVGLMTMPDPSFSEKETRRVYEKTRELNIKIAKELDLQKQMVELSMGMSSDFKWAIAEGATYIRIGTAIFGERD